VEAAEASAVEAVAATVTVDPVVAAQATVETVVAPEASAVATRSSPTIKFMPLAYQPT